MKLCTTKIELRREIKKIDKKIKELTRLVEKKKACVVVINNKLITVY